MKKVSVIIPVYKVEEYLNTCVESVLNQTYKNLEIILIDDGSPDRCGQICDNYQKKDSRIKVIHKKNGGLSSARNMGIDIAEGEYITFVDGDDFIHPQMIELLECGISKENADLAIGLIALTDTNDVVYATGMDKLQYSVKNRDEYWHLNYEGAYLSSQRIMCPAKLYKRHLISQVKFPEGRTHEDVFWSSDCAALFNKIIIYRYELYFYYQRSGSIMHTLTAKNIKDEVDAAFYLAKKCEDVFAFFKEKQFDEFKKSYYKNLYKINYLELNQAREVKKYFCDKYSEHLLYLKTVTFGQKIFLSCMRFLPIFFINKMSDYHFNFFEYFIKSLKTHMKVKGKNNE